MARKAAWNHRCTPMGERGLHRGRPKMAKLGSRTWCMGWWNWAILVEIDMPSVSRIESLKPNHLGSDATHPIVLPPTPMRSRWIISRWTAEAAASLEGVKVLQLLATVLTTVATKSSGFPIHDCLPTSGLTLWRSGTGDPPWNLSTWISWRSYNWSLRMRSSCSSADVMSRTSRGMSPTIIPRCTLNEEKIWRGW